MTFEKMKEWQEKLQNGFEVDMLYASMNKKLSAIKRKKINDKYFLELSIFYNHNKELVAVIDLNHIVSEEKKNMFLAQTVRTLYSECILKDTRINNNKIIDSTKEGTWLFEFDRLYEEFKIKIENNEVL